jgi:hypothetical protein
MLSHHAEEATTQAAFRHLSDALFTQGMGGRSLEDVTRELLRGMLKQWLDDNLPPLVERSGARGNRPRCPQRALSLTPEQRGYSRNLHDVCVALPINPGGVP